MKNQKKMAAVSAAVFAYIRTQEEMASLNAQQSAQAPQYAEPVQIVVPAKPMPLWGVSGRQAQMQMRNLMQLKAFHGLKLR